MHTHYYGQVSPTPRAGGGGIIDSVRFAAITAAETFLPEKARLSRRDTHVPASSVCKESEDEAFLLA